MKKLIKSILLILSRREKTTAVKLLFLDVIISLLDIGFLVLLLYIIQFYTQQAQVSNFPFKIFYHYPLLPIILFFLLFSAKNTFGFYIMKMQLKFVYNVASRLSNQNLLNFLDADYQTYINTDSSVIIRETSHQPIEFSHYVLTGIQQILSQSVLIVLTITAVIIYNPVLFLFLFIVLSPAVIIAAYLMKKRLKAIHQDAKEQSEKTIQHLKEALSAFVESNLFQRKAFFSNRYHKAQTNFNNILSDQLVMQNMPSRFIEIFAVLGLLLLITIETFTGKTGAVHIITIGAFMAAAYKIIPGIVKILAASGQIKAYRFTVVHLLKNVSSKSRRSKEVPSPGSISFRNVSFSFNKNPLLQNISFNISKGDLTGISGLSGKGKTTLVNLLLGFLNPDTGTVLINGAVTSASERTNSWKNISYVKQQPLLIHDTFLKNITLDDDFCDFDKLEEVMRVTGLHDVIKNYPEGFNKIISENGRNMSGGQRQRIVMARALYKEADLIILDEPFSELDRRSEDRLLNHFKKLAVMGKMILFITHNCESLSFCHKIISLDEKKCALADHINPRLS